MKFKKQKNGFKNIKKQSDNFVLNNDAATGTHSCNDYGGIA